MVLHCSIHYKEEILYEQSDVKKTLIANIGKNISYTTFYLFSSGKSRSSTQLMKVYNGKINVAVSPCTKIESVFQKYKKTQARKVKIHVY